MAYVKIKDGVVVQKQPNKQTGFEQAPDSVVCGMIKQGNNFVNPRISKQNIDNELSDEIEDIIDSMSVAARAKIPNRTLDRYNAKKSKIE